MSETEGCPPSIHFNIVLEILSRETRQMKKLKGTQMGKEEVKISYLEDYLVASINDPKN